MAVSKFVLFLAVVHNVGKMQWTNLSCSSKRHFDYCVVIR